MPTYQYACTACDERLEAVQKFTDDPLTTCEVCGGSLRKVYSPVGIVFKGSGFYRTDSRNGSGRPEAKDKDAKDKAKQANSSGDGSSGQGEAPAGSGSSAEKSGSGEAKPAKKAEKPGRSGAGSKVA